jgi:putative endonuclease
MANIRKNDGLNSRIKGNSGEDVACKYLENKGFHIVMRNYRKVWGELDIIADKDKKLHFVEVKSVTFRDLDDFEMSAHKPEDNVHGLKIRHIRRMVQTYIEEFNIGQDREFQFHVLCVYLNLSKRMAKVRMIENIIL